MNGCGRCMPRYDESSNMAASRRRLRHLELAETVARLPQLGILRFDQVARGRRQQAVERVLVHAARERLAPLGFVNDGDRIVAEDRAPQVDPGPVQRARGGPVVHVRTAETLRVGQQTWIDLR